MKTKRIFLVIFAILMFSTCVNADDFTIRNGIEFGDSIESVKEKEVLGYVDYIPEPDENNETYLYSIVGNVAGIDDSQIIYYFSNDKLYELDYFLGSGANDTDLEHLKSNYETIYEGLVKKYGEPLDNINGDTVHVITTRAINNMLNSLLWPESHKNGFGNIYKYNEWIIHFENYNVKIDLTSSYYGRDNEIVTCNLVVGYKYFTNEELEDIVKENEEQKQAKQKKLDDDL